MPAPQGRRVAVVMGHDEPLQPGLNLVPPAPAPRPRRLIAFVIGGIEPAEAVRVGPGVQVPPPAGPATHQATDDLPGLRGYSEQVVFPVGPAQGAGGFFPTDPTAARKVVTRLGDHCDLPLSLS